MAAELTRQVIAALDQFGASTAQARPFDFYLYFPTEGAASAAARELAEVGFRCEVRPAALGPQWLCLAAANLVPSETGLETVAHLMATMAEDFGGDFDGWETRLQTH